MRHGVAALALAAALGCAHRDALDRASGTEDWHGAALDGDDVSDDVFVREARAAWEQGRRLWERERAANEAAYARLRAVAASMLRSAGRRRSPPAPPRPPEPAPEPESEPQPQIEPDPEPATPLGDDDELPPELRPRPRS